MMNLLFSFQGRLNRAKWWLINIGAGVVEMIVFAVLFGGTAMMIMADPDQALVAMSGTNAIVVVIVSVIAFWIGLSVAVRRFHDRNKSGWWVLIVLVPVIGSLWFLIECGFLRGTAGPNSYGPDPLSAL
jgi:uncharacterized membrane protein YhaH (DUF805 family)